jgi:hypothetical protein
MTLAEPLSEFVRAAFTGLWIQSFEHDDAIAEIARLCLEPTGNLAAWDIDRGLCMYSRGSESGTAAGASDPLSAIRRAEAGGLHPGPRFGARRLADLGGPGTVAGRG